MSEINRVRFDDQRVTVEQLETRVKASGTYLSTVSVNEGGDNE